MPKSDDEVVPDFAADPPAREGYVWKRSDHIKKWNKRWFVLWPAKNRPGDGRVLFWFDKPGDKKAKGTVKLVPGSFNLQCHDGSMGKGDRDFPLTVLIEVPNRDPVRLATDNERETRGWVGAMQSLDSPRASDTGALNAAGGALGAPPQGSRLLPQLSGNRMKGFGGHSAAGGRASAAAIAASDGGDPTVLLREALFLFLPAADVATGGKDLLAQARHAASQREKTVEQEGELEAAKRSITQMETRLRESEASVVALQEAHAVDVAQAEESLSELRGENRLLTADVESLSKQAAGMMDSADLTSDRSASPGGSGAAVAAAADFAAELEAVISKLREDLTQSQEESGTLKLRLDHSETQAQKFQVDNRSLRAQLESAADTGATESERLAEVQVENSELMGAVMEARAATSQAAALAESEKAAADTLRAERGVVDAALFVARKDAAEQKVQVAQLSEELEALSEAVVDDAGGAEKLEELEMIVEELENQLAEDGEAKKQAEVALAESEAKLKQVADMAREKVMALSKENAELKKAKGGKR